MVLWVVDFWNLFAIPTSCHRIAQTPFHRCTVISLRRLLFCMSHFICDIKRANRWIYRMRTTTTESQSEIPDWEREIQNVWKITHKNFKENIQMTNGHFWILSKAYGDFSLRTAISCLRFIAHANDWPSIKTLLRNDLTLRLSLWCKILFEYSLIGNGPRICYGDWWNESQHTNRQSKGDLLR